MKITSQVENKHVHPSARINTVSDRLCVVKRRDGLPIVLYVADELPDALAVKPSSGGYLRPLWFLKTMIFIFEADLVNGLRRAYREGDKATMNGLWAQAREWIKEA